MPKIAASSGFFVCAAAIALLLPAIPALAQPSVGQGPSTSFIYNLPSEQLGQSLGGSYARAEHFISPGAPGAYTDLMRVRGFYTNMFTSMQRPLTGASMVGRGGDIAKVMGLRFRSLDSLRFQDRARLMKLRKVSLRLAERLRERDEKALEKFATGFRHFIFPFGLGDMTKQLGYGFFSHLSLADGTIKDPKAYLAAFTDEAQQSIGEDRFLDAAEILVLGGELPNERGVDDFYNPQLAALGNYLFNNRRYAKAAEAWAILAKRDPSSSVYKQAQGLCLFAAGDMLHAAPLLRQSLKDAAGEGFFISGENLQDIFPSANDLVSSRTELAALLEARPDDADLNFLTAYIDLFQGNWPAAETRLAVLSKNGDEAAAMLLKLLEEKKVPASVQRPTSAADKKQLAQYTGLEEGPMTDEELGQLVSALQEAKTYEDFMRIGDFKFFMGDYTLAEQAYRSAAKLKPKDPYSLFALTHVRFATGEYRSAIRSLKEALAFQEDWGLFDFRIQELYGSIEEYQQHLRSLERKVELRPQDLDAKFLLAYIYYFSGRYADAVDLLVVVTKKAPEYSEAQYFLRLARLHG